MLWVPMLRRGARAVVVLAVAARGLAQDGVLEVRAVPRIVVPVDVSERTMLPGNSRAVQSGQRVAAATPMRNMMLVLRNSEEQESALRSLLDAQQDKGSGHYHAWTTPVEFAARFGVADADVAKITAWLQASGLTVERVSAGGRIVVFSGAAGAVEAAFGTEVRTYTVGGTTAIGNAGDLSVPAALGGVVAGVAGLNSAPLRAQPVQPGRVAIGRDGQMHPMARGTAAPDYTSARDGMHALGAGDLATIYDTKPLLAAGVDGTGQKIGVVGRTEISLADVQIYRSIFGLPNNDPTVVQMGGEPGVNGEDAESELDLELAGAMAPMAALTLVTTGQSYSGGGVDAGALYLVENNDVDIISVSYGQCEADAGSGENAFYAALWEQAAAQGQTVFVSAGDSGAADCDSAFAPYATGGYAVSGFASTPFNVAVGGTMFAEGAGTGATAFWSGAGGMPYATALSYVPEVPWNEGNGGTKTFNALAAGGGGISTLYGTPSFQTGPGVPANDPVAVRGATVPGPHRYLPDLALAAGAGHDPAVYCAEGSCTTDEHGAVLTVGLVGGTSVGTPTMAGIQALVNQLNGGRQGLANYVYYRIAAARSQANCGMVRSGAGTVCAFHDVTAGNNNVTVDAGGGNTIGFAAGPGYDLATGLGSVDAANLATLWATVSFHATATTLAVTPTGSLVHGTPQNFSIAVAPVAGSGTPTGDVSVIAQTAYGGIGFFPLANGAASGVLPALPGGTYAVSAHYGGDGTYGGSNSAPLAVTVTPEPSVVTANAFLLDATGLPSSTMPFPYGGDVYIDVSVAGASQTGSPSGKVTFLLTNGARNLPPVATKLDSSGNVYFDAGAGLPDFSIAATAPVLAPGNYTVNVAYAGDASFNAANATPLTFAVGPVTETLSLQAVSARVASGGTATLYASMATVAASAGGATPSGAVTFFDGATNLGSGTLAQGAVVFSTTALVAAGMHTITAVYAGDTNYAGVTSAGVDVEVGGGAAAVTVSASAATAPVGTAITLTASVTAGATGTIFFLDNGVAVARGALSGASASVAVTNFTAGRHSLTANFSGDGTMAASTSAAVVVEVTQNQPTLQLSVQQGNATGPIVSMNALLTPAPAGTKPDDPAPGGPVQFLEGTTVLGAAVPVYLQGGSRNYVATVNTTALAPGVHTLVARYAGDANYAGTSSNPAQVGIGLTTTALTSSASSVGTGTAFSLTARVTPLVASSEAMGGTVTFYDGATPLGTANVVGRAATLAGATLPSAGSHPLTAVYSGDAHFYISVSGAVDVAAVAAGLSLGLAPGSLTVTRGVAGSTVVTLTATGGYAGSVALSCSGLPAEASCTFAQATITFGGTTGLQTSVAQTTTLTIGTVAPAATGGTRTVSFLVLPGSLMAALLCMRRQKAAPWRPLLLAACLGLAVAGTAGCGSIITALGPVTPPPPFTPTGTSTVTVLGAATGAAAGSQNLQLTAALNLNVQ